MKKEDLIHELEQLQKKIKRRHIINISLIIIISVLVCSFLVKIIMFGQDFGYDLRGENNNFIYENALFIKAQNKYYLIHGNLSIKNDKIKKITSVSIMCDDRLILMTSGVLSGISTENKGYDELFPKTVVNNIDKWYLKITYTINDKEYTDILNISSKKWTKGIKTQKISNDI